MSPAAGFTSRHPERIGSLGVAFVRMYSPVSAERLTCRGNHTHSLAVCGQAGLGHQDMRAQCPAATAEPAPVQVVACPGPRAPFALRRLVMEPKCARDKVCVRDVTVRTVTSRVSGM